MHAARRRQIGVVAASAALIVFGYLYSRGVTDLPEFAVALAVVAGVAGGMVAVGGRGGR